MKKLLLSVVLVTLAACAYSPQQITINPRIDIAGESYGNGRAISVLGEDGRENPVLGTRGGIYKDTSTITLSNDLVQAMVGAAKAKLATQGFNVNSDQPNATLTLVVDQLSYDVPDGLPKTIDLKCALRVVAQSGGETYTGRYTTGSNLKTVMTPSMARNEELVNKLLSDTLVRAFSDPKLIAFLSNI